jgi:hypothetical protein
VVRSDNGYLDSADRFLARLTAPVVGSANRLFAEGGTEKSNDSLKFRTSKA